jgi:poly-beta-1,6-N-acetyl-D-glucosamine synthase
MHNVFAEDSSAVSFVKNQKALVETEACENWGSFFQQRKRWASKWGAYQLFYVKIIALLVFLLNVCYALLPFALLMGENLMRWVLIAYLLRWLVDAIFLREILCFSKKPFNLVSYLKLAVLYPYYVVYSGLAGRAGKYEWKGRTVS